MPEWYSVPEQHSGQLAAHRSRCHRHRLDLRFLDRDLGQEYLVLGGRAIAYAFAVTQLTRWAIENYADTGRAKAAVEFLKAGIAGIAAQFDLLAAGVLDDDDGSTRQPINGATSRSIPVHTP